MCGGVVMAKCVLAQKRGLPTPMDDVLGVSERAVAIVSVKGF